MENSLLRKEEDGEDDDGTEFGEAAYAVQMLLSCGDWHLARCQETRLVESAVTNEALDTVVRCLIKCYTTTWYLFFCL